MAMPDARGRGPERVLRRWGWPGRGTHPWHGPCGDFSIVPPAVLAQGRLHGLAATGSPRPRRIDSSRTLESAGDKDAFARPANALRGAACCACWQYPAFPRLPSSAGGAERHAPVQQRKGAAAHLSVLPSRGRHAWNARGSLITDRHVRPTAPTTGDTPSCEACRSPAPGATPSRIGENCYE